MHDLAVARHLHPGGHIRREHDVEGHVLGIDLGIDARQHAPGRRREEASGDIQERIFCVEGSHEFLKVLTRRGIRNGKRAFSARRFDHRLVRGACGPGRKHGRQQRREREAAEQHGASYHWRPLPG